MKTDPQVRLTVGTGREGPFHAARIGDLAKALELGLKVDTYVLMTLAFADGQAEVRSALHTATVGKTG